MYDADGKPVLGPAAILDEAADRAAHEKCAMDLRANEWKPPGAGLDLSKATDLAAVALVLKAPRAPAPRSKAATQQKIGSMLFQLGRMVAAELKPLKERISALEAREWVGVFEAGKSYAKDAIVSHDGSAWVATRAYPEGKPGTGPACGWRLIVKRGRDGKDAK